MITDTWTKLGNDNGPFLFLFFLTQTCSSDDSGCNMHMEIMDRQNSSNPVKLILWKIEEKLPSYF